MTVLGYPLSEWVAALWFPILGLTVLAVGMCVVAVVERRRP